MAKKLTKFRQIMRDAGYVTVAEAAALAGVHIATVYRALDDGQLDETRHGRFRFISRESLAAYYSAPPIAARIVDTDLDELDVPDDEPDAGEDAPCTST